eukprot:243857-Prymnesium_polylepis.1
MAGRLQVLRRPHADGPQPEPGRPLRPHLLSLPRRPLPALPPQSAAATSTHRRRPANHRLGAHPTQRRCESPTFSAPLRRRHVAAPPHAQTPPCRARGLSRRRRPRHTALASDWLARAKRRRPRVPACVPSCMPCEPTCDPCVPDALCAARGPCISVVRPHAPDMHTMVDAHAKKRARPMRTGTRRCTFRRALSCVCNGYPDTGL